MDELLSKDLFAGNTVADAAQFVGYLFLTFLAAKLLQAVFKGVLSKWAARSKNKFDDILLAAFRQPIYWIALVTGLDASLNSLHLPAGLNEVVGNVTTVLVMMFLAWSISNLITGLRTVYVDPLVESTESRLDDQIIPIVEKTLKVATWSFALLIAFDNIGFDIVSLLTGLGIGGLALAMAAKDTLANVFGSVTIFADQPFQVDDVITIKGHTGTVVDLGLRTCRLRTFEGTLVTIPNSLMVGDCIENLSARAARKFNGTIGLVYSTTSDQLTAAMQALRDILAAHPKVREDYAVRFANFGDSALQLTVLYWVVPPGEYFDVVSEINVTIKQRFDAEGWEMAFPSMTLYKGD